MTNNPALLFPNKKGDRFEICPRVYNMKRFSLTVQVLFKQDLNPSVQLAAFVGLI